MEINDSNLLLYLKGDDFTDSSIYNHAITNHGTTINTVVKKTGTGSMENSSSGPTRVEVPYNKIFDIGTGDFTVEFWINVKSFSTDTQLVSGNIRNALFVGFNTRGCFGIGRAAVAWDIATDQSVAKTYNTWQHLAVSRHNGTVYLFVNGKLWKTGSNTISYTMEGGTLTVPSQMKAYGGNLYMDSVKFYNVAKYTSEFSPSGGTFIKMNGMWIPIDNLTINTK